MINWIHFYLSLFREKNIKKKRERIDKLPFVYWKMKKEQLALILLNKVNKKIDKLETKQ